jgi:hypothetical protein
MKRIKSVSFYAVYQHSGKDWHRDTVVSFEMVEKWLKVDTDKEEQVEQTSWIEFVCCTEEIEILIQKLQSVIDRSNAAYDQEIKKEVQP